VIELARESGLWNAVAALVILQAVAERFWNERKKRIVMSRQHNVISKIIFVVSMTMDLPKFGSVSGTEVVVKRGVHAGTSFQGL